MHSHTFLSHDPDTSAMDVDHGELGLRAERAMNNPAYWNQNHPHHYRAVSEVRSAFEAIYGDKPVGGQAFNSLQTINTATGEVMAADQLQQLYGSPTVFNANAIDDTVSKAD